MGLAKFFGSNQLGPVETRLDARWFGAWFDHVLEGQGRPRTEEAIQDLLVKAEMVIDRDCADYVHRYCAAKSARAYQSYRESDACTPWGLVGVAAAANRDGGQQWVDFITNDVEAKLTRFAEILIEPSVAQ